MISGQPTVHRLVVAIVLTLAGLSAVAPTGTAEPCPDIGVAFARGTGEQPGLGAVGQRFIDSLRAQAFPRTVGGYGVNYPASSNFADGQAFTMNVVDGVRDEANHVQGVTSVCPQTRMVLGGYSQGAVVTAFVTSGMPAGVSAGPAPSISADAAEHVDAVVLFGTPAGQSLVKYGAPAVDVGPMYTAKSLEFCAPGDNVCSGGSVPGVNGAHGQYAVNGMVDQAAAFAVSRLARPPAPMY